MSVQVSIQPTEPDQLLARFWQELRGDERVSGLAALIPSDRELTIADALPLLPAVMVTLRQPQDQLRLLQALVGAGVRAGVLEAREV